jgi:hypothetical protein
MNWQSIEVSINQNNFLYNGNLLFAENFLEVLEFQYPGIAGVKDQYGWFHITPNGNRLYPHYFERVFGFYFNRACVNQNKEAFHIGLDGLPVYSEKYLWCGNYQENIAVVKDFTNQYFHIDLDGNKIYPEKYSYAGDFRESIACVMLPNGNFTHIDKTGNFLHGKEFELLDVYHKGFARAKDKNGWFHIDRNGNEIYKTRFLLIEPFYNGFAFGMNKNGKKIVISEKGIISEI